MPNVEDKYKRVLLVTFSRNCNYGGTLQEFALYAYLKDKYSVECLDYIDPLIRANSRIVRTGLFLAAFMVAKRLFARNSPLYKHDAENISINDKPPSMVKDYIRDGINLLKVFISDVLNYKFRKELVQSYNNFWKQYISYTQPYTEKELFSNPPSNYDIYVAGSDQIWNPVQFGLSKIYFLCFAHRGSRKISYAPSFANFHFSDNNLSKTIIEYLSDYDAISVREEYSCHELENLGINARNHIDPTLLLTKETWAATLNINLSVQKEPYLLAYAMSNHKKVYDFAIEAGLVLSLDVRIIGYRPNGKAMPGVSYLPSTSPNEFVELFMNAAFVITNSFHGTAFSINFNIPFICVESNHPERINNLLNMTGLTSRVRSFKDCVTQVVQKEDVIVDFTCANSFISLERERSIRYLESAINNLPEELNQ